MTMATEILTADECFQESAKALRDKKIDLANNWRLLGDSIVGAEAQAVANQRP